MDRKKLGLSIVIPCFNEAENISFLLKKLNQIIPNDLYKIEIIIVDGCSTDETAMILKREFHKLDERTFSLVLMKNRLGYGNDIMEGLKTARYDYLCWTHADLQTDPQDVIRGLEILRASNLKNSIIKGKRKSRPALDVLLTASMQLIVLLILNVNLNDINAQPKIFSRDFYDNFLKKGSPKDFSLDLFALYQAKKNNFEILSFPVEFKKRELGDAKGGGGSLRNRVNLIRRTFKYIRELKKGLPSPSQ
tara:strand:- start:144 stop:890 length:747 start_codon:yes stop_codon:yes gene_type:complete